MIMQTFLGMPNEKYIEFIMNPDKWGGAIELSILSTHYQVTTIQKFLIDLSRKLIAD